MQHSKHTHAQKRIYWIDTNTSNAICVIDRVGMPDDPRAESAQKYQKSKSKNIVFQQEKLLNMYIKIQCVKNRVVKNFQSDLFFLAIHFFKFLNGFCVSLSLFFGYFFLSNILACAGSHYFILSFIL